MPPDNLYPPPPRNALGNLGLPEIVGVARGVNALQASQAELGANRALGEALTGSVDPNTGLPDVAKAGSTFARDPRAAYGPVAIQAADAIQRHNVAQFAQAAREQTYINDAVGGLQHKPDLTKRDVIERILMIGRNVPSINRQKIADYVSALPDDPAKLKEVAADLGNWAISSSNLAQRVTGPPNPETGAATQVPLGAVNRPVVGGVSGAVTTGLPPGSEKSAGVMQEDLARARNFGQEIVPWQKALEKLQALGPGGTGPGSKGRQEFQSFLFALSPTISRWGGVDPDKLKNYAEAEKYLTQATQTRAASFGAHTDLALSTAITGSPNVHINEMASEDVAKVAIALRRMEQVQTLETAKLGGVNYTSNSAKWAASQNPRAYALDMMPAAEIVKLNKQLKGEERVKFNASLRAAIDNGVISEEKIREILSKGK